MSLTCLQAELTVGRIAATQSGPWKPFSRPRAACQERLSRMRIPLCRCRTSPEDVESMTLWVSADSAAVEGSGGRPARAWLCPVTGDATQGRGLVNRGAGAALSMPEATAEVFTART